MNDQAMRMQGLQNYHYERKDPTVDTAADAVTALKKRAETLRKQLAQVDTWKAELATVERMLTAAESK